jgi:HD-GYP domain-containing protein (c-di-GMP phosphodiesterase class II)
VYASHDQPHRDPDIRGPASMAGCRPHGLTSHQLSPAARILGAADRYQAMTQYRAHRSAVSPEAAAAELRRMAAAGEVDGDAAECVPTAAGHAAQRHLVANPPS